MPRKTPVKAKRQAARGSASSTPIKEEDKSPAAEVRSTRSNARSSGGPSPKEKTISTPTKQKSRATQNTPKKTEPESVSARGTRSTDRQSIKTPAKVTPPTSTRRSPAKTKEPPSSAKRKKEPETPSSGRSTRGRGSRAESDSPVKGTPAKRRRTAAATFPVVSSGKRKATQKTQPKSTGRRGRPKRVLPSKEESEKDEEHADEEPADEEEEMEEDEQVETAEEQEPTEEDEPTEEEEEESPKTPKKRGRGRTPKVEAFSSPLKTAGRGRRKGLKQQTPKKDATPKKSPKASPVTDATIEESTLKATRGRRSTQRSAGASEHQATTPVSGRSVRSSTRRSGSKRSTTATKSEEKSEEMPPEETERETKAEVAEEKPAKIGEDKEKPATTDEGGEKMEASAETKAEQHVAEKSEKTDETDSKKIEPLTDEEKKRKREEEEEEAAAQASKKFKPENGEVFAPKEGAVAELDEEEPMEVDSAAPSAPEEKNPAPEETKAEVDETDKATEASKKEEAEGKKAFDVKPEEAAAKAQDSTPSSTESAAETKENKAPAEAKVETTSTDSEAKTAAEASKESVPPTKAEKSEDKAEPPAISTSSDKSEVKASAESEKSTVAAEKTAEDKVGSSTESVAPKKAASDDVQLVNDKEEKKMNVVESTEPKSEKKTTAEPESSSAKNLCPDNDASSKAADEKTVADSDSVQEILKDDNTITISWGNSQKPTIVPEVESSKPVDGKIAVNGIGLEGKKDELKVNGAAETKEIRLMSATWGESVVRKYRENFQLNTENLKVAEQKFSVVSYNVCGVHEIESKREKLVTELEQLEPAIVCLQDVDSSYYEKKLEQTLKSLSYSVVFHKNKAVDKGLVTACKSSLFEVVNSKGCDIHELVQKDVESTSLEEKEKESLTSFLRRQTSVSYITLKSVSSKNTLCVCNVLLPPEDVSVTALQVAVVTRELTRQSEGSGNPHVLCGTFSLKKSVPGYQVLKDGYLSNEMIEDLQARKDVPFPDKENQALINLLWKCFQHPSSSLKSSYNLILGEEMKFPSEVTTDYVWYSSDSLSLLGVLDAVGKDKNDAGFVENSHLSLKADFGFVN